MPSRYALACRAYDTPPAARPQPRRAGRTALRPQRAQSLEVLLALTSPTPFAQEPETLALALGSLGEGPDGAP